MLGDARTGILASEAHGWPAVVAAWKNDVHFVAAIRSVFVIPDIAGDGCTISPSVLRWPSV
jgi:hypothetical protein